MYQFWKEMQILLLVFLSGFVLIETKTDVPPPATHVQVDCLPQSAIVSFRYDDAIDQTDQIPYEFHLQYNDNPQEQSTWQTYPVPTKILEDNQGRIKFPLYPYAKFTFRIVARNRYGDSSPAYSKMKVCWTPPTIPHSNPFGVHTRTSNVTENSLEICWAHMPRHQWNGPEFYYLVEYKPVDASREFRSVAVPNTSNCLTIPDQPIYRQFEIRVWAANNIGRSNNLPIIIRGYSAEGKPIAAPSGFRLSSSTSLRGNKATFVWDPVSESIVLGKLKHYKIFHWSEDDRNKKIAYFGPEANSGEIHTLKSNQINYAAISIENWSGKESQISDVINFTMQKGVPSKVNCLRAIFESNGLIRVTWNSPTFFNDLPIGYELHWCSRKAEESEKGDNVSVERCVKVPILNVNETEYSIIDVEKNREYTIKVAAICASGTGERCSVKVNVDKMPPLSGPILLKPELSLIQGLHREAKITWVFDTNGMDKTRLISEQQLNITAFAKFKRQNDQFYRTVPVPNDQKWIVLTGLCPGTIYNATVTHFIEYEPERWSRTEFSAIFRTAEPKDRNCVEESLRVR